MTKYEKLDALILASIDSGRHSSGSIATGYTRIEAERIATAQPLYDMAKRILDRRLQALRKAGHIKATGKGWIRAGDPS
ncbi:hypothetical protein [Burkholderia anthina]|uniref:Uncharacterized protein n=1 Tax=Burkholderia anthina TaxID=179879 RepID=A0A6P2GDP5_9BURK|nr:hypothetical protein [Burkholderia anthina]MBM2769874.1 hypothetical protein [Burkholderia anthina]VVU51848.1 hypothetical protein BAN20980_04571 [Burkholderia anthina]